MQYPQLFEPVARPAAYVPETRDQGLTAVFAARRVFWRIASNRDCKSFYSCGSEVFINASVSSIVRRVISAPLRRISAMNSS